MTERRAYILLIAGSVLLELGLTGGFALLGAGTDLLVSAYVLLACGTGLGVGLIATHYH
jgi:hypothetical protein